ncbi:Membrane associated serine protease, rhomboid family [Rhizobium sp. NFR07]|nr:Membrane associated serine protease, rhomboid family [Rhizobium sp. NFR07]
MDDRPDMAPDDAFEEKERRPSPPAFNLPGILLASLALLVGLYVVQEYVLTGDQRLAFIVELAFTPIRYAYPLADQSYEWLWTPVTYSLLHGGVEHIAFNGLWLAAFGAPVVRRIGTVRYLLFWVFSAAASAFFHAAVHWGEETLLIGASGVVSALMGAACRFAFPSGGGYDRNFGHLHPRLSIARALSNRTVLMFTGMWLAGNVLIAVGLPLIGSDVGEIAWDAHIGGFLFGFLLFSLFDPIRYREL